MDDVPTSSPSPEQLSNLIVSLEQATLMAKQLPSTTNPTHLFQIQTSLHHAHLHLSAFLSAAAAAGGDPMEEEDENSKAPNIERVEEQMRSCFIKNKKSRKRQLSPSALAAAAAEERRVYGDGVGGRAVGFDPRENRVRALELLYQFHM